MSTEISVKDQALIDAINRLAQLQNGTGYKQHYTSKLMEQSSGKTAAQINITYEKLAAVEKALIDVAQKTGMALLYALQKFNDADHAGIIERIGECLNKGVDTSKSVSFGNVQIGATGNSKVYREVKLDGQDTNYTCGSASGSMILNSLGVPVSEEAFWNYANANGNGTYVYRVAETLNHFLGKDAYRYVQTSKMSLDEYADMITTSLMNGYPVELPASIPSGTGFGYSTGGHYFVINGIGRNSDGEYVVSITDPFSKSWGSNGHQGQKLEMKLSDIKTYNARHSAYVICNRG